MNKELFKEYAQIKAQMKELEVLGDEISAKIASEMNENEVEKVESDFGSFYFTKRKLWKYSGKVEEISTQLKEQKKKEEEEGTASFEESKSLTFKSK